MVTFSFLCLIACQMTSFNWVSAASRETRNKKKTGRWWLRFSSRQGHGYKVIFARDIDVRAGKDCDGIVLSRTRLMAMFFLSTKEETGSG